MPYSKLLKGRYSANSWEYLVTAVCDHRRRIFAIPAHAEAFGQEIRRIETDGDVEWLAWVIMPDHFHALLRLVGERSLSNAMRLLKGRTARRVPGPVWQRGFHDHALRTEESRLETARYLLANPVRSGVSGSLREYPYWYCRWMQPGDDPDEFLLR